MIRKIKTCKFGRQEDCKHYGCLGESEWEMKGDEGR